ncbi:hypothetical protein BT93_J0127 [Corymbia citriodora subsp. variegata]|nr:hypothetical protein BT93_J0127 [Corymbia citriodora subsp. variegata]
MLVFGPLLCAFGLSFFSIFARPLLIPFLVHAISFVQDFCNCCSSLIGSTCFHD